MTASPLDSLAEKLFDIPEREFDQLVTTLETRRLRDNQRAAALVMLAQMRPRLRLARPPRRYTPLRLFCRPFQDLLYDPKTPRKAMGRIPRASIAPIWTLVESALEAEIAQATEAAKALDSEDAAAVDAVGKPLWAAAHRALVERRDAAAREKGGRKALQDRLGDANMLAALDDVITALAIAGPVTTMCRTLPAPPIAEVDGDGLAAIVEALTRTAAIDRGGLPTLVMILMARLKSPAMLPHLIERLVAEGVGDLVGSASSQVGEAVASQREDRLVDVRTETEQQREDPVAVARALGKELKTLEREAAAAGGGGRGVARQIERVKAELGRIARETVVSGAAPKARDAIAALDQAAGSAQESRDRFRAVEDQIVSLRLCRQYAGDVGLEAEIDGALKSIGGDLGQRSEGLLKRLEANDAAVSSTDLFCTVRLVELIEGSEKAEALRQKGMAAMLGR